MKIDYSAIAWSFKGLFIFFLVKSSFTLVWQLISVHMSFAEQKNKFDMNLDYDCEFLVGCENGEQEVQYRL